jgi:hypothetical protein
VAGFLRRVVGEAPPAAAREPDPKLKFCSDLTLMKHRAMELGLYETMHRLDSAIRMAGFEVSGDRDACRKHEAANARAVARAQGGRRGS